MARLDFKNGYFGLISSATSPQYLGYRIQATMRVVLLAEWSHVQCGPSKRNGFWIAHGVALFSGASVCVSHTQMFTTGY